MSAGGALHSSALVDRNRQLRIPRLSIESLGIASAQGNAAEISTRQTPVPPRYLSLFHTDRSLDRPVPGVNDSLTGQHRWRELARRALADCTAGKDLPPDVPLIIASCNGSAAGHNSREWLAGFDTSLLLDGTQWEGRRKPIVSGSCASGLQALFLASWILQHYARGVIVLAVDIISQGNHQNFDSLRILASSHELPFQGNSSGFVPGEAAVALYLRNLGPEAGDIALSVPLLGQDIAPGDGLARLLNAFDASAFDGFIVGQGVGPHEGDEKELAELKSRFPLTVPMTTPVYRYGHALGSSSLLSLALASLTLQTGEDLFRIPHARTYDGRYFFDGSMNATECVVTCRALDGHCGIALLSPYGSLNGTLHPDWLPVPPPGPLFNRTLRSIAHDAIRFRPFEPPSVLIVRLDTPLMPASESIFGKRILPSSVLEITPGYVSQLIAKCWGFTGPAITLVGDSSTRGESDLLTEGCLASGLSVHVVQVGGLGELREIDWNAIES